MENITSPKFVGYTRVSKLDQVINGVSLEAQEARIREWAKQRGAVEVGMFVDAGISGKSTEGRPGLADAMAAARKHKATLVVYSLSRLARSTRDALRISDELKTARANLVSLTEQIDTTNGMGKIFFTLMAAFAELERDTCSERTKMAMAHKRANHQRTSNRIPYGYDLADDGVALVANAEEAAILTSIRAWRREGLSVRAIGKRLAVMGVKTKLGCAAWSPSTIMRLCREQKLLDTAPKV